jgi:S-DNA-T family DNA segregation ATPase FtsK/SpoIIIE
MLKATVTEIHLCCRCPRLLAYHRSGEKNTWNVGYRGTGHFKGAFFHDKIAKPFHTMLSSKNDSPLKTDMEKLLSTNPSNMEIAVFTLLKQHILDPVLSRYARKLTSNQILSIANGVVIWSRYLSNFLKQHARPGHSHQNTRRFDTTETFCDPEKLMSCKFYLSNGKSLRVTGAFDAVWIDQATGDATVIEFKGFKPAHEEEDFIQVALYGWMIKEATGITPRCVVLYLEEEHPEAVYPARVVENAQDNLISLLEVVWDVIQQSPKKGNSSIPFALDRNLCDVCPFASRCDTDWGKRRRITEQQQENKRSPVEKDITESETDTENEQIRESEQAMDRLLRTLNMVKLPVISSGFISGPRLIRLKVKPDIKRGTTFRKISSRVDDLQIAMELKSPPFIRAQAGYLSIDIPRKFIQPLTLTELWERGQNTNKNRSVAAFPMGMAIDGSVEWADLTNPTMTSILVAGTAGSGKSIFLRTAIIGMAMNAGPNLINFTLIDPKRVTFNDLSDLPHLRCPVITDIKPALEVLEELMDETENRYKILSDAGVIDIAEYNNKNNPIAHHVIIIDEYADLMIEKDLKSSAENLIQRLCQKGRAAGFHIILSTQRPDSKVVTPLIKANLQLKVALKVTTTCNSQIILDEPGAEKLIGNGDMLVGGAIPIMRLQGSLPTKTEINMVKSNPINIR